MFEKWLKSSGMKPTAPVREGEFPALNAMETDLAIEFLQNLNTLLPLSRQEALLVAQHLQSRRYIFEEVILRAGDNSNTDYMLWILEGQAIIEAVSNNPKNPVMMTVLEPGSSLGEVGLLDGMARSANCTAGSAMRCAMLTRFSLLSLCATHPEVGIKLVLIISLNMASRLRDVTEKFHRFVLMANAISDELMSSSLPTPIWPNRTVRSSYVPAYDHHADPVSSSANAPQV